MQYHKWDEQEVVHADTCAECNVKLTLGVCEQSEDQREKGNADGVEK